MKLAFKDRLVRQLQRQIASIETKLEKYRALNAELRECKEALKSLGAAPNGHDFADSHFNPDNAGPLSESGIKVLSAVPREFSIDAVVPLLGNDRSAAYQYIASWKRAGRIDTVARGAYRKCEG